MSLVPGGTKRTGLPLSVFMSRSSASAFNRCSDRSTSSQGRTPSKTGCARRASREPFLRRAAARRLFRAAGVRRAVGAEEELRISRDRRLDQRLAVRLALEHGQAIVVRANAAQEKGVAVQEQ